MYSDKVEVLRFESEPYRKSHLDQNDRPNKNGLLHYNDKINNNNLKHKFIYHNGNGYHNTFVFKIMHIGSIVILHENSRERLFDCCGEE